jgi:hypothetical protein
LYLAVDGTEGNSNNDAPEDNLNKGAADLETPNYQQADDADTNEGLKRIGNKDSLVGCLSGICHDAVLPSSTEIIMLFSNTAASPWQSSP